MFVQVIQGHVTDSDQLHAALDRWSEQLAAGAAGWLGTTAGVTGDGEFVALARFESEDAAQRNSDRPEQDAWWAETSKLFSGEVAFHDSTEVDVDLHGDPDEAGFVQIIKGRSSNSERVRELMASDNIDWGAVRPDIIASLSVDYGDGDYYTAIYFTSETEARENEAKELPADMQASMDEMRSLNEGEPEFLDIRDPWLYSPEA